MANIYEVKEEALHELLAESSGDEATVVIPELQRPYVWKPSQVILLVDSLIRGWPVGTLLMWRVKEKELSEIPHRPFWRMIDRTENGDSIQAMRRNPPGNFRMVLDGQQRVQSLLLALGGDDWGFKLEDRDWAEDLQGQRPRGRAHRHKHWSKACLCFDLEAFLVEYREAGERLLSVEFRNVLKWSIMDPTYGQSNWQKPENYSEPLVKGFAEPHNKQLVRLSRLWQEAQADSNLKEKEFRTSVESFLKEQFIAKDKIEELLVPLGEFMTTLRDVKLSKVTTLELCPFDERSWRVEEYNDAIVSIFTRLNTAGRTLTREEITFAWLKSNWKPTLTGGNSAADCFEELRAELKSSGLDIKMDDVVNAVSFIWSVRFNKGKLLANNDLLKGSVIRPMAEDLSQSWSAVKDSIVEVAKLVQEREITYGTAGQFASVNALAVLWAWSTLRRLWPTTHLTVPEQDAFNKQCDGTLKAYVDRWLLCSTWSGRWSGASNTAVSAYAKVLNQDWVAIENQTSFNKVHRVLEQRLVQLMDGLEQDASDHVNNVSAPSRERVSVYRNVLWAWHRLDADRWSKSRIPLRIGGRTKATLEVDHTVSYAFWEERVEKGLPKGCDDRDDALVIANSLGNCSLLEKTFNISRGRQTLGAFMEQVMEIQDGNPGLEDWAKALSISDELLTPDGHETDNIAKAIKARDTAIRKEVIEFIKGSRERKDLSGP